MIKLATAKLLNLELVWDDPKKSSSYRFMEMKKVRMWFYQKKLNICYNCFILETKRTKKKHKNINMNLDYPKFPRHWVSTKKVQNESAKYYYFIL